MVRAYDEKMYAKGCKSASDFKVILKNSNDVKLNQIVYSSKGYELNINLVDTPLAAGTYKIEFYAKWGKTDIKDYGVVIYSASNIAILDKASLTSRPTSHD